MLGKRHLYAMLYAIALVVKQASCPERGNVSTTPLSARTPSAGSALPGVASHPRCSSDTFPQARALAFITVVLVTRRSAIHQTLGIPRQSRIGGPMGATNSHFCSLVSWVCIPSYTQPAWAKKCQRKALIWRGWSSLQCIYIIPLNAIY